MKTLYHKVVKCIKNENNLCRQGEFYFIHKHDDNYYMIDFKNNLIHLSKNEYKVHFEENLYD